VKKLYRLLTSCMVVMMLTGCLYPQSELAKNQVPNEAQLEMVQSAVEQYKENNNGIVPIKTKENDVSLYEKYVVDFTKLREEQYLAEIPGTAYENGGVYQYVLIDPEDAVAVKLIDLRLTDKLREVNLKLNEYRVKNTYPPFGEQIEKGVFRLNYEKLGYKSEPYVVSPYSSENLPFVINADGELFIDYRLDLAKMLEEYEHEFKEGDDIRPILTDNAPFVPSYSLPYTLEGNEPKFLIK